MQAKGTLQNSKPDCLSETFDATMSEGLENTLRDYQLQAVDLGGDGNCQFNCIAAGLDSVDSAQVH